MDYTRREKPQNIRDGKGFYMANWEGAGYGAASGAGIGSAFGGAGAPIGAVVGGLAGLFSKKKKRPKALVAPDISGELAKLDALYGTQRELLTQDVARQTGLMQGQTAQSLANRGILSSPVSEASFGRVRASGQQALSGGLAELYGQQATARSAALNSLLQYNQNIQQANQARQQASYDRQQQFQNQMLGVGLNLGTQALGGYLQNRQPNQFAQPNQNVQGMYNPSGFNLQQTQPIQPDFLRYQQPKPLVWG